MSTNNQPGRSIQLWDASALVRALVNGDSALREPRLMSRDLPSAALGSASSPSAATNAGTRPGRVGRKKGAFSGAAGASVGRLRSLIRSRFARFCLPRWGGWCLLFVVSG
jgi:hypothetical protein